MNVQDIERAVAAEVASRPSIALVLLFGSRARGTSHADSDVDLGLLGAVDELAFAAGVGRRLGVDVDGVRLEDASRALLGAVLRDAVVLYARTPTSFGKFVSQAVLELDLDRWAWERARDAFLQRVSRSGLDHG
jgi:predicted nucleotidyltransferase